VFVVVAVVVVVVVVVSNLETSTIRRPRRPQLGYCTTEIKLI
jgi:hypothetical protein